MNELGDSEDLVRIAQKPSNFKGKSFKIWWFLRDSKFQKKIEKKNQFRCPLTLGVKFYTECARHISFKKILNPAPR